MTNFRESRKKDQNKNAVNHIQDFTKDSINFFNKCTKPDRTGKCSSLIGSRVLEDIAGMRNGFLGDWHDWVLDQAGLYPHQ